MKPKVYTTKTGKIAVKKVTGYVNYYTREELKKQRELYTTKFKDPIIDVDYLISIEGIKEYFPIGLKKALCYVEEDGTTLWNSLVTKISRTVLHRMLSGQYLPSFQNFMRLIYYFDCHIPNFNIWCLVDPAAPVQRKEGYRPFKSDEYVVYPKRAKSLPKDWL